MDNKALNPINIARNSFGRRRITIYLKQNPTMVFLVPCTYLTPLTGLSQHGYAR